MYLGCLRSNRESLCGWSKVSAGVNGGHQVSQGKEAAPAKETERRIPEVGGIQQWAASWIQRGCFKKDRCVKCSCEAENEQDSSGP